MALHPRTSWRLTIAGWLLFTVSAVFFVIGALRDGGPVELVASAMFLIACLIFLIPAIADRPRRR